MIARRPALFLLRFVAIGLVAVACSGAPAASPAKTDGAKPTTAPAAAAPKQAAATSLQYRMGGGPSGGIFGIFGGAVSEIAQKAVPGLSMTAVASQGSAENVTRTSQGEFHFALAGNDAAYLGYNGAEGFPSKMQDFRVVMSGHKAHGHMMVPADSEIKTWADLKGKRIALTAPTSPNNVWAAAVLEHYGLKQADYAPQWLNSGQYVDAMKNGTIDAGSLQVGYPTPATQELCTWRSGVRLLPVPPEAAQAVAQKLPFFSPSSIPAGIYPCVNEEIRTVATSTLLIAHKDVPDDVVYAVTKRIIEEKELAAVHQAGKEWTPETALAGTAGLPVHPGAEKYFREKGIMK